MATDPNHPPGTPMTLANMRERCVHHLIAYCLNDAPKHSDSICCGRPLLCCARWLLSI
jgi:hypothetical protein